jgi:hypothetical protein
LFHCWSLYYHSFHYWHQCHLLNVYWASLVFTLSDLNMNASEEEILWALLLWCSMRIWQLFFIIFHYNSKLWRHFCKVEILPSKYTFFLIWYF